MKRSVALVALPLILGACSGADGRELARYYDPEGLFSVDLPAADVISVTPPQAGQGGPGLLTGVVAQPPAPSPAPQTGLGFGFSQTEDPDRTIYQALAVTTDGFEDLSEMALFFLTADPAIDVQLDEPVRVDGHEGRLVVADVTNDRQTTASLAVAMTLGRGGTGYLVVAVFPSGEWEDERSDFLSVLESFRSDVPPGLGTFPVTGEAA